MLQKSYKMFIGFIFLVSIFSIQLLYIAKTKTVTTEAKKMKNDFVKVTGLPDLALSTEANYIRHRSISDIFSIYRDDGTLREYAPSSYIYAPSKVLYEN
jgi:hypothetical protein